MATFYTMYKHEPAGEYQVGRLHQHAVRDHGRRPDLRRARRAPRRRRRRRTATGTTTSSHRTARSAVERLECNAACDYAPVVMVNWEFFDNHDAGVGQAAGRRPAARRSTPAPTRGPSRLCTWKQATRILAGFGDGQAAEGPSAGRQPGRPELAKERGWKAPEARSAEASATGAETLGTTDLLTPVLTANWDQPDSFTLDGYKRHRRVQGAAEGAGDGAGRRHRHGEGRGRCAAAAARASRPA